MTIRTTDQTLAEIVFDRLSGANLDDRAGQFVLAALEDDGALEGALAGEAAAAVEAPAAAETEPVGAYLTSLSVEGFRGIGPRATLELAPGPGLTVVMGRNGSGKSSFAEALEVLLTGDNQRWAKRTAVWREGWRNLHHPTAAIEATLAVEGSSGPTTVRRAWADGATDVHDSEAELQPHGEPKAGLEALGWDEAIVMYRPFLSYNELGSMLDEGPAKLHDAMSAVLGLDELTHAEKALKDARAAREAEVKKVEAERKTILGLLEGLADDRARACVRALCVSPPLFADVESNVLVGGDDGASEVGVLRRLLSHQPPDVEAVRAAAERIRSTRRTLADIVGTEADQLLRGAELLEEALAFREDYPNESCPVCETPGIFTPEWVEAAAAQAERQRALASAANSARSAADEALRRARQLVADVPQAIRDVRPVLDVQPVLDEWAGWLALLEERDPDRFAAGLEERIQPLVDAVDELKMAAAEEVERREDAWRPIAAQIAAWLPSARSAYAKADTVKALKDAEKWLKQESVSIRNARFTPIADEAIAIWRLLRHRSSVELGSIELEGVGNRRRVNLDVTIDGEEGAALGVMSQGELHALALSLFFPRATLPESPFRFIVIDDPVQSMDPAKVDGLARVLERTAASRQVVVFTHDDRLSEAIRRLDIHARILEVARKESSVVEVRQALDPVERHVADARALLRTDELPNEVARRVIPGLCRFAIEAACMDAVRRRRIGRGDTHAEVEDELSKATRLTVHASLALFDTRERGGDVLSTLNAKFGGRATDAFRKSNQGTHQPVSGDLYDLVSDSAKLARALAEQP
jgi:recombinational DNA repair ATPase RecF